MRATYADSQFVKDHRIRKIAENPCYKLFRRMQEVYSQMLLKAVDSSAMQLQNIDEGAAMFNIAILTKVSYWSS